MEERNKNKNKLDLNDWKILNQLDLNCRQSDSEIGKKTRISKQVVNYRIKKLIENDFVKGFVPLINPVKLGYSTHKLYVKFKSLLKKEEENLLNYLLRQPEIVWIIWCSGRWDLVIGIVSRDIEEFDKTLNNFMEKYSKFVSERVISVFNQATIHHRKWILDDKDINWLIGGRIENAKIDNINKKILEILNKNARTPIIEISDKIKISSSLVIQRIKKLIKNGIICSFRADINRKKIGRDYCKAFIFYQNKTSEKEKELLNYCKSLNEIVGISKSIGPWDLELEFEVKNYYYFNNIMREMKNKFPIIANFETVFIEREYGISFLPRRL